MKFYREALTTELFSILRNDFLSQITAQLELTESNHPLQNITTTTVTSSDSAFISSQAQMHWP
jgi:hypothetical protein